MPIIPRRAIWAKKNERRQDNLHFDNAAAPTITVGSVNASQQHI